MPVARFSPGMVTLVVPAGSGLGIEFDARMVVVPRYSACAPTLSCPRVCQLLISIVATGHETVYVLLFQSRCHLFAAV